MSGGSYNYAYQHLENLSGEIRANAHGRSCETLRLAFADHLDLCAAAAHAIEWVDSCDRAEGSEQEHLERVIVPELELETAVGRANEAREKLIAALLRCGK